MPLHSRSSYGNELNHLSFSHTSSLGKEQQGKCHRPWLGSSEEEGSEDMEIMHVRVRRETEEKDAKKEKEKGLTTNYLLS